MTGANINTDESQKGQSSFEKGVDLEMAFCEFMKSDLGWEKARTRAQMKSATNNRGINVDIIAERENIRSKQLWVSGLIGLSLSGGTLIFDAFNDSLFLSITIIVTTIFSGYLILSSQKIIKEHAWVECKNQKGNVSNIQMQKMINDFDAYKLSKDKEHRFVMNYFVSGTNFSESALKLAQDKNILCYIPKNGIFVEVNYWD